jgi:flagellar protein FliS|tara:strand:- start:483 stop:863 length:381 start_codon:yes stop_codon:yes gene_type:complete
MKHINAAAQYKNTDKMEVIQPDANSVLIKCFDELIKSVKIFQTNIIPNTENFRKKSSSFSRALTILYTLQSSVDFEKDLNIAKSLFQVYEYTRVTLIEEFKSCKVNKSINALTALTEIRDSWKSIS